MAYQSVAESDLPPLLGDGRGNFRVHIVGNSGSGKSTVGRKLAAILKVPFVAMDTLMWKPGWEASTPQEFQGKLRNALELPSEDDPDHELDTSWVVDGDYLHLGGPIAMDYATDIIWLDPPILLYFPRLVLRTVRRLLRLQAPCSPGCNERLSEVLFSKESIVWWCISHHWSSRQRNRGRMELMGLGLSSSPDWWFERTVHSALGSDSRRRKMRRIGGWGSDLEKWLEDGRKMVNL